MTEQEPAKPANARHWKRALILTAGVVTSALVLLLTYVLNAYQPLPVDPAWELAAGDRAKQGALTVRFSGTSTLLFDDGETAWMVDGWFSRPGLLQLALGHIAPDLEAIKSGLAKNEADALAAVIPVHSHYDHAMDAPEVARRTGAKLLGSESTANIGRGWGLPEAQIQVLQHRQPVTLGAFTITPIESRHFQFPDPAMWQRALAEPDITEPLIPPAAVFEYRVGKAYVLHVAHPSGTFVIVGSAGFVEDSLQALNAEVIFLSIGGLGSQSEGYRESYWRETVAAAGAERVIPIHYDSLTGPLEGPFRGPAVATALLSPGLKNTRTFLREKARQNPQLVFETLPRFEQITLFR